MTAITPATGGTITAATAEGCLYQALALAQQLEADSGKNPNRLDRFTGTEDSNTFEFRGNWGLQLNQERISGATKYSAVNYLVNAGFTAGSGGTFTSTSLEAYIWEVISFLVETQNTPLKNPNNRFWVVGSIDLGVNPVFVSGTFRLPYTTQLNSSGGIINKPAEYLGN